LQLGQANGRLDIRHSVVISDNWKPVPPGWIHSLPAENSHSGSSIRIIGGNHSSLTGGDDLVAEKTEYATVRQAADSPPTYLRAVRFRSVLDYPETMTVGDLVDCMHVSRMPIQMHGNNPFCPGCDLAKSCRWIDIHCL